MSCSCPHVTKLRGSVLVRWARHGGSLRPASCGGGAVYGRDPRADEGVTVGGGAVDAAVLSGVLLSMPLLASVRPAGCAPRAEWLKRPLWYAPFGGQSAVDGGGGTPTSARRCSASLVKAASASVLQVSSSRSLVSCSYWAFRSRASAQHTVLSALSRWTRSCISARRPAASFATSSSCTSSCPWVSATRPDSPCNSSKHRCTALSRSADSLASACASVS
mmetsp:Transcript_118897/g.337100  ORF Transcript_118897/g.337100 Transcript_118897/m.337100 type:complete len:220 (+) Transcript_118897:127-786(+)